MRKKIFTILILVGFFSLQYGKIVGYLYCKWQAQIVQDLKDCGCDDHLVSMFEHDVDSGTNDQQKNMVIEKLNEFMPMQFVEVQHNIFTSEKSFTDYISSLSDNFIASPFHPPAV